MVLCHRIADPNIRTEYRRQKHRCDRLTEIRNQASRLEDREVLGHRGIPKGSVRLRTNTPMVQVLTATRRECASLQGGPL
jgi:hypothetical protein